MLTEWCRRDNFIAPIFVGVYSCNKIPKFLLNYNKSVPACAIINTERMGSNGHWLAIFIDNSQRIEIFDSFGMSLTAYVFLHKLVSNYPQVVMQNKQIQHPTSWHCGFYCLYFLYKRCRGASFESICNQFAWGSTIDHDNFVIHFIKQLV